jgi:hypothetical protein
LTRACLVEGLLMACLSRLTTRFFGSVEDERSQLALCRGPRWVPAQQGEPTCRRPPASVPGAVWGSPLARAHACPDPAPRPVCAGSGRSGRSVGWARWTDSSADGAARLQSETMTSVSYKINFLICSFWRLSLSTWVVNDENLIPFTTVYRDPCRGVAEPMYFSVF